jgi:hypothetical protein
MDLQLDDPPDPLDALQVQKRLSPARRPPRVIDATWDKLLKAHDGDYGRAKTTMDRALVEAAQVAGH